MHPPLLFCVIFKLNDVEYGGSTVFPMLDVAVRPQKGSMLVWHNLYRNGTGNFQTMHASCPIVIGQKWSKAFGISLIIFSEGGHGLLFL